MLLHACTPFLIDPTPAVFLLRQQCVPKAAQKPKAVEQAAAAGGTGSGSGTGAAVDPVATAKAAALRAKEQQVGSRALRHGWCACVWPKLQCGQQCARCSILERHPSPTAMLQAQAAQKPQGQQAAADQQVSLWCAGLFRRRPGCRLPY